MISERTIIICSFIFALAAISFAFEEVFEDMSGQYFISPIIEQDMYLVRQELAQQAAFLQNINNDSYFHDMISKTDVYQAFVTKYPQHQIDRTDTNDTSIIYTVFYSDYVSPYAAIMVDFEISWVGAISTEHRCMVDGYHLKKHNAMPTTMWINAGVCQDVISESREERGASDVTYFDTEFDDMLLDAFDELQERIAGNYSPVSGVTLDSVNLEGDVIILFVDVSDMDSSQPLTGVTDSVLDLFEHTVPIEIVFLE